MLAIAVERQAHHGVSVLQSLRTQQAASSAHIKLLEDQLTQARVENKRLQSHIQSLRSARQAVSHQTFRLSCHTGSSFSSCCGLRFSGKASQLLVRCNQFGFRLGQGAGSAFVNSAAVCHISEQWQATNLGIDIRRADTITSQPTPSLRAVCRPVDSTLAGRLLLSLMWLHFRYAADPTET